MQSLFLSPHNDDESLFGAYTLLREKPFVVVCFQSKKQYIYGITADQRQKETDAAMKILGCEWYQIQSFYDDFDSSEYDRIRKDLQYFIRYNWGSDKYDKVYAPTIEGPNANDGHNMIGEIADRIWGSRVIHYMTYTWPEGQSTNGIEVPYKTWDETKPEESWTELKYQAMQCYQSQINLPSTAPHFKNHEMSEYYEFS